MKDLKVEDKIEVEITKIIFGEDEKVYVTVDSPLFDNRPIFLLKEGSFVWKSESGRISIK